MSSFINRVALLFSFLLLSTSVFAAPTFDKRSQLRRDSSRGETNAQRFARGLPPLAPVWKARGSRTFAAKRTVPSNIPSVDTALTTGTITVSNSQGVIGALQFVNGYYIVSNEDPAAFSNTGANFYDAATGYYLAGLITPYTNLESDASTYATLGGSPSTGGGVPPQSDGTASIPDTSYESAIWSTSNGVSPTWVNYDYTTPEVTLVSFANDVYITADVDGFTGTHPGAEVVTFAFS